MAVVRVVMDTSDAVGAKLRDALGMDDVSDFVVALQSLPKSELAEYLTNVLSDETAAKEIAALMGAPAANVQSTGDSAPSAQNGARWHRKGDGDGEEEPFAAGHAGKKKGHKGGGAPGRAASALVGGASVVRAKTKEKGKSLASLDALRSAMRPGRHPCSCNARRHPLLTNCLSCGKVICEQEGRGPCLFCGNDPDDPQASSHLAEGSPEHVAAAERARQFKERLLDFDRSSAKRTTVIDDQVDYFSNAAADAWLSQDEKAQAQAAQRAREDEQERKRRELRLTLDFGSLKIVREGEGQAGASGEQINDARDADGPCCEVGDESGDANEAKRRTAGQSGAGKGTASKGACGKAAAGKGCKVNREAAMASEMALRTCSADYVDGADDEQATGSGGGGRGARVQSTFDLINPTLASRPLFVSAKGSGQNAAETSVGGAGSEDTTELYAQAMTQGLQYSVRRVQHDDDNPWLHSLLGKAAEAGGGDDLEGAHLQRMAEEAQEQRRLSQNAAGVRSLASAADISPMGRGQHDASSRAVADEDDAPSADGRQFCLSMHQPWASLLVAGIKRVEGRPWRTDHRGRLWIASTSREPTDLEVATVEQQYMERYSGVHTSPAFPTAYPPSALLGCITVVDCLSNAEYVASDPDGEENESNFIFVCNNPLTLPMPMRISGQHKIYALPADLAAAARAALRSGGSKPSSH